MRCGDYLFSIHALNKPNLHMYIFTILVFGVLFWTAEQPGRWVLVARDDVFVSLAVAWLPPLIMGMICWWTSRRAIRLLEERPENSVAAQLFQHRSMLAFRCFLLVGIGSAVQLTHWPTWFAFDRYHPVLKIFGDLIVVAPAFIGIVLLWAAGFPFEQRMRASSTFSQLDGSHPSLSLGRYVMFNLRHQILVVAAPLTLILFASNVVRSYDRVLQNIFGWVWAPEAILIASAGAVFTFAPVLLCRIWHTQSMEPGPIRSSLEAMCERIGLRFRDILIWHSDGMMINAAVMGIIPSVRYVLLSDGLLEVMSDRQVEAVFGHEAGHIRHRHIPFFLLFAFVGWLLVAGLMELLIRLGGSSTSTWLVQTVGVVATVAVWGGGFGWISRRFERQADVFGASCVTPEPGECHLPCSVHLETGLVLDGDDRVCASGASIFASALDRVAALNGIPLEERSWRHSSIGSRIRFLTSLADDPKQAHAFARLVGRAKLALLLIATVGSVVSVYYWFSATQIGLLSSGVTSM